MATCDWRGIAFFSFFQALREIRGVEAEEATRAALPTHLRDGFRLGAITRVGWYPMRDFDSLHVAAVRACGGGESLSREIGAAATDIDTRGMLKFILSFASVRLAIRHSDKIMSAYARGGEARTTELDERRYELAFTNMIGASRHVFAAFEGAVSVLAQRTGANDVVVTRRSMDEAAGRCVLVVEWK